MGLVKGKCFPLSKIRREYCFGLVGVTTSGLEALDFVDLDLDDIMTIFKKGVKGKIEYGRKIFELVKISVSLNHTLMGMFN